MFKLLSARAVTCVLALIVISPYCIQINSSEGEGVVHVCMHMRARQESRWVGILAQGGGVEGVVVV